MALKYNEFAMATDGNEPPGPWAGVLSYRINRLLSLPGFYNKTCVWITFPSSLLPGEAGCCSISPRLRWGKCNQRYQKGCFWKAGTRLGRQPHHWAAAGLQVPVWTLPPSRWCLAQQSACSRVQWCDGEVGLSCWRWSNAAVFQGEEKCVRWAWDPTSFQHLALSGIWAKGFLSSGINWFYLLVCCYNKVQLLRTLQRAAVSLSFKSTWDGVWDSHVQNVHKIWRFL